MRKRNFDLTMGRIRAIFEARRVHALRLGAAPSEPPFLIHSSRLPAAPRAARRWRSAIQEQRRHVPVRLQPWGHPARRSRLAVTRAQEALS